MNTVLPPDFSSRILPILLTLLFSLSVPALAEKPASQPGAIVNTPPDITYFALEGDTLSMYRKTFYRQIK